MSSEHYIDTYRYESVEGRQRRGRLMHELSRGHTMCMITEVLRGEIDQALCEVFGSPAHPRLVQVFGVGARHAFQRPDLRVSVDPERVADPGLRAYIESSLDEHIERALLSGPPFALPADGIALPDNRIDKEWAEARNVRQRHMAEWGISEERTWRVALACAYADLVDLLNERSELAGVDAGPLYDGGPDALTDFLAKIPTAYTFACVDDVTLRNSQHVWKPNDFHDIIMLSQAAVYCDIVVVDRVWSNFFQRSRAPRTAIVTNRLSDVAEMVIGQATA